MEDELVAFACKNAYEVSLDRAGERFVFEIGGAKNFVRLGIPTYGELDDLCDALTDFVKDVRALKQEEVTTEVITPEEVTEVV